MPEVTNETALFQLTATYTPGKDLVVPDTLSWSQLHISEVHSQLQDEVEEYVQAAASLKLSISHKVLIQC